MENAVDVKNIFEVVKEKLEAMESCLDNMSNRIKALKGCLKE